MSIYKPTEDELRQLEEDRKNYPRDEGKDMVTDMITYVDLPGFILRVDYVNCGKCDVDYTYWHDQNSSIAAIYDFSPFAKEIRELLWNTHASKLKIIPDNTKIYSQQGYVKEEILSCNIEIINLIDWLENMREIDSTFPSILSLPEELVAHHKEKGKYIKTSQNKEMCKEGEDLEKLKQEEQKFLAIKFDDVTLDFLGLEPNLKEVLEQRFKEMQICIKNNAPLAAILMAGSLLEGILSLFLKKSRNLECSWSLAKLIDVSYDKGYLREDVKKFSDGLRNFRNYIHPEKQVKANFNPDMHTAKMCRQALCATITNLKKQKIV
ncbi:MAG: hypothetical protein LBU35_00445 [Holosporales bacterium]|nr:hypothetical protein [Holosporales bacterium]